MRWGGRIAAITANIMVALLALIVPAMAAQPILPELVPSGRTFSVGFGTIDTSVIATATDIAGNAYMVGQTNAATAVVVFGKDANGQDVGFGGSSGMTFVVKYDPAGVVLWATKLASDIANQAVTGIALSGGTTPTVYVTGWLSTTSKTFGMPGNIFTVAPLPNPDAATPIPYVVKIAGDTGTLAWAEGFGIPGLQLKPSNVAVSSDGANIYLVGAGDGSSGAPVVNYNGTTGAFLVRIDETTLNSPVRGSLVPYVADTGGSVTLTSAAVAASGDVFAVGTVQGANLVLPTGFPNLTTGAGLLAGYDASLATEKVLANVSGTGFVPAMLSSVTTQGTDIYYTGTWRGGNLILPETGGGGNLILSSTGSDIYGFVAKASITDITAQTANGRNVIWAVPFGGVGVNMVSPDTASFVAGIQPAPVAVDASGNVSVAMISNGAADPASPAVIRVGNARNIVVARLSSGGAFIDGISMGADAGFVLGSASGVAASGLFTLGGKMTTAFTVPSLQHSIDPADGLLLRTAPTYTLTAAKDGTGTGKVTSDVGGIDCGTACTSTTLNAGTSVTLTAVADAGSTFAGWAGVCTGATSPISITLNSAATCTATFTLNTTPPPTPTPMPPAPPPPFVVAPPATIENASTVGSGSGSLSFASSFTNNANLTFSAAPSGGGSLPSWLSFDPASVSFNFNVPLPPDLPIQPLAAGDTRTGRADARATWSNTVYPMLLRVAQLPVVLTATDRTTGQSYASTIQMSFYAPRNPVAISAVSMSLDRALGNKSSGRSALSFDGGQMLFETASTNLFAASPSPYGDIVRYHGLSGARDRLSQTAIPGGGVANGADGQSSSPAVSADGAYGAFASDAPGVSETPAGGKRQVYRVSLAYPRVALNPAVTPAPLMVSVTAAGVAGNGTSDNPSASQDGRYVAFDSTATNLAAGLDGTRRVWRKDLSTGELAQVGVGSNPSISWDGRFVAFEAAGQVQLKDLTTGNVRSVGAGTSARLSARADRVAFVQSSKVVQVELATGVTRQVGDGDQPAMSADGRFVAFRSVGANGNGFTQVWLRDVERGVTALVTQTAAGAGGNGNSLFPSVSGDGAQVGFVSAASDLVNGSPTGIQAYVAANPLPLPEKTGYWYLASSNSGQGWLMERWGNQAYVAGLVYDAAGQASWASGFCQVTGLTCAGTLVSRSGGAAFGAASGPSPVAGAGVAFSLATSEDGRSTTLKVGEGAAQTLTMFPIGGTATTGFAGLPQAGWWMETGSTGGNGYFIAVDTQPQADGSVRQIAYVSILTFDLSGRPVWYSSQAALGSDLGFAGTLMQYGAPSGVSAIGQLRIAFTGSDTALINLPNGRTAAIGRFRF